MPDIKVGDKVRFHDGGVIHYEVKEISTLGGEHSYSPIVRLEGLLDWFPASRFVLVPPEKPKYRMRNVGSVLMVRLGNEETARIYFGHGEAAKTVEDAKRALHAAMEALGYEEEWDA